MSKFKSAKNEKDKIYGEPDSEGSKGGRGGRSVSELSRELGINPQTFYNWKKKYSGMNGEQLKRLKELEDENRRLKQLYADAALYNRMLKDVLSKKW